MKYVRTKNSIREIIDDYDTSCAVKSNHRKTIGGFTVIWGLHFAPRADTIEELCDELVVIKKREHLILCTTDDIETYLPNDIYGAIWTEWGLKYVAKMNDKGELELL